MKHYMITIEGARADVEHWEGVTAEWLCGLTFAEAKEMLENCDLSALEIDVEEAPTLDEAAEMYVAAAHERGALEMEQEQS